MSTLSNVIKRVLCVIPLIFLLGTIVLLLLINLSGVPSAGLTQFYFSVADVDGDVFWTMYGRCVAKGSQYGCTVPMAAYPYAPALEIVGDVPDSFFQNVNFYFYGLRVGYAMLLMSLVVSFVCLIPMAELAYYCRLKGLFAPIITAFGLLFVIVGAVMETVVHLKGVHAFQDNNQDAQLGVATFICMWVSVLGFMVVFASVFVGRALYKKQNSPAFYEDKSGEESLDAK